MMDYDRVDVVRMHMMTSKFAPSVQGTKKIFFQISKHQSSIPPRVCRNPSQRGMEVFATAACQTLPRTLRANGLAQHTDEARKLALSTLHYSTR